MRLVLASAVAVLLLGASAPGRAETRATARARLRVRTLHLDLVPPGDKAKETVDRFADFLATMRPRYLHHSKLQPRYAQGRWQLRLHGELLLSPDPVERGRSRQILELAHDHGVRIDSPPLPGRDQTWLRRTLRRFGYAPDPHASGASHWLPKPHATRP